jgi:5-bromo-4-chloroindolyl phosphate hydrolysis protein
LATAITVIIFIIISAFINIIIIITIVLGNTDALATAINSLPELQRKKAVLDTHTITATAILKVRIHGLRVFLYCWPSV